MFADITIRHSDIDQTRIEVTTYLWDQGRIVARQEVIEDSNVIVATRGAIHLQRHLEFIHALHPGLSVECRMSREVRHYLQNTGDYAGFANAFDRINTPITIAA